MASHSSPTFLDNLKALPGNLWNAIFRHGRPTSDRARSQAVFSNVFLHIHSARVHPHSLRLATTWGLGGGLVAPVIILTGTGILLMVYYMPAPVRGRTAAPPPTPNPLAVSSRNESGYTLAL